MSFFIRPSRKVTVVNHRDQELNPDHRRWKQASMLATEASMLATVAKKERAKEQV